MDTAVAGAFDVVWHQSVSANERHAIIRQMLVMLIVFGEV